MHKKKKEMTLLHMHPSSRFMKNLGPFRELQMPSRRNFSQGIIFPKHTRNHHTVRTNFKTKSFFSRT